ncbi:MAG TPA: response regulator [Pyrinomonadaceae bacterium]|nr:response regulator [Pyrinomonadaceae bacterium]
MSELSSNQKVLVVDDQNDNLVLVSLAVQEMGFRVVTAVNGEDAVAVALLGRPQLILMDIAMPRMDGIEATRSIRQRQEIRDVPIVILSAFDTDDFRRRAEQAGVNGYLTKPIDFDRLRVLIDKLLRGTSSEEREATRAAISPETGRLDPRFMLWRMFCAESNIAVETLPSELNREQKKRWDSLKKNKSPLFKF